MSIVLNVAIDSDNDALVNWPQAELARILRKLADTVHNLGEDNGGYLFDVNGNKVGEWNAEIEGGLDDD